MLHVSLGRYFELGFFLLNSAMLGTQPVPPYAMDLEDGHPEVENYEVQLHKASRPHALITCSPMTQFFADLIW